MAIRSTTRLWMAEDSAAPQPVALVGGHDEVHADRPAVAGQRGEQVEPALSAAWLS